MVYSKYKTSGSNEKKAYLFAKTTSKMQTIQANDSFRKYAQLITKQKAEVIISMKLGKLKNFIMI